MRLHLVRHPAPQVPRGTCYGSSDPPPVDGALAAAREALLPQLPAAARVFTSPLQRCLLFARALVHARPGTTLHVDARLAEMDFGSWELRRWDDIPREHVDAWCADPLHYRPGGGETVAEVARRVLGFLRDRMHEAAAAPAAGGDACKDTIVVCHAGTIRLAEALLLHGEADAAALHAFGTPASIPYASTRLLRLDQENGSRLLL